MAGHCFARLRGCSLRLDPNSTLGITYENCELPACAGR